VLRVAPLDNVACEKLAVLYTGTRNWEELAYIARMRLGSDANDLQAHQWLAEALIRLNKASEAQQDLEPFIQRLEPLRSKHVEYAKACIALSQAILAGEAAETKAEALKQLDKAVASDANSAEALASRAQFYRQTSNLPDVNGVPRLTRARQDLESADKLGTNDPRVRYALGIEWMAHGELDRAAAELQAIDKFAPQALEESFFFDMDGWKVRRFLLAAELTIRRGAAEEGATLADETLKALKESRHRIQVLPTAIKLYVAADKAAKARECLDEYLKARHTQEEATQSREDLALLQALVARADPNWYGVIDMLQPVVVGGTSRPESRRLLAEAFVRTGQDRRAVSVLSSYLQDRPADREMTLQLANEYIRLHDWPRALEIARRAEALAPADYQVRLFRIKAGIYAAGEQQPKPAPASFSKLSEELAQLRTGHPDQVDIRIQQAIIADYLEQSDQAEAELKLAIEECQEPLRAEMRLARHYLRLKPADVNQAARVCRDACERHPQVAEPWLTLAELRTRSGQYQAASDCLKKGLDAVTDPWEMRSLSIRLAVLELTTGDRATGIKRLRDLAEQDPNEIHARSLLLNTRELQQDPDRTKAQALIDELKKSQGGNGVCKRRHQAELWLASPDWRSKQRTLPNCCKSA
jgi:tetratricopeptide (TPR) repeat protein